MKRIITLLFSGLLLMTWSLQAQEIDESFVFVDDEGEVIPNGAILVRNQVVYGEENVVIYSGVSVMNAVGSNDYIKMHYTIERIDNGIYQICFPTTCNMEDEVGSFETGQGQLMSDVQDIMSEWFPAADGECIVKLTIELFSREGFFPPTYVHKAFGPTITLHFIKGDIPNPGVPGDVNGDGEVNISDVNAVIDMILSQSSDRAGDVNGDGEVNIADVNAVIDLILNQ